MTADQRRAVDAIREAVRPQLLIVDLADDETVRVAADGHSFTVMPRGRIFASAEPPVLALTAEERKGVYP
jgi:hypothetical protein